MQTYLPLQPEQLLEESALDFDELERRRAKMKRRNGGRITYNCFQARERGLRVVCAKGYRLGMADDTISLAEVLNGTLAWVCRTCLEYETE